MKEKTYSQIFFDILFKIKNLIRYYDLGFVLNNLDSVIILPTPVKTSTISMEEYYNNKTLYNEMYINIKSVFEKFNNELVLRKSTFEEIKQHYPNFTLDIDKKLDLERYQEYLKLLKFCSNDISKLVTSFDNVEDNYSEQILFRKDIISGIIDNEYNSRLTFIQDSFILEELNSLDCSNMNSETQRNIELIKIDLTKRIERYDEFKRLYSSNTTIRLSIPNKNNKKEYEERD